MRMLLQLRWNSFTFVPYLRTQYKIIKLEHYIWTQYTNSRYNTIKRRDTLLTLGHSKWEGYL